MPLDHARDVVSEVFDDDDMPPLVEDDTGPTYTFFPGMTPLSFSSTSAPAATQDTSPQPSSSFVSSPPTSPSTPDPTTHTFTMTTAQAGPHVHMAAPEPNEARPRALGKRRDASRPGPSRPPNAFILFRCAFIKEQNVPGKVEGNHSRLSKIIGLCWKQLPPEEREKWEAKAVVAQAEYRAHYPDWRFRPGANAMAKLKNKEGEASGSRRRSVRRVKDAPAEEQDDILPPASDSKGKGKEKGKGKTKATHTISLDESRCAKIAGFVAEGIKGKELEVAVKQWEGDHILPRSTTTMQPVKSRGRGARGILPSHNRSRSDVTFVALSPSHSSKLDRGDSSEAPSSTQTHNPPTSPLNITNPPDSGTGTNQPRSTAASPAVELSDVPLTHMFKRSLSVPAQNARSPLQSPTSDPSDSSTEDPSPTSAEPSPVAWGSFKTAVPQDSPTGTHSHRQRNPIMFPTTSNSVTPVYDPLQQFTWQEAENRRRLEEVQEPNLWWSQKSPAIEAQFGYGAERGTPVNVSSNEMGYEIPQGGSQFERNYLENYGSFDSPQDESRQPKWTDLSTSHGRQGLAIVLEDPYKDDCNNTNNQPVASSNGLSLPPLSSSNYYYSPLSPVATSPFTSSSFSTLTGWAGEYKHDISEHQPWPDTASTAHSASSTPWYSPENTSGWAVSPPQLQHAQLSHERDDWERLEYRAASHLHLAVEPARQLSFQEELRRANSNSS